MISLHITSIGDQMKNRIQTFFRITLETRIDEVFAWT